MLTYLRYALATVCFAASAGCLAFWITWTNSQSSFLSSRWSALLDTNRGMASVTCCGGTPNHPRADLNFAVYDSLEPEWIFDEMERQGIFGRNGSNIYFPLWYPALIFALAGVGVLRFRRQFSIRSALMTTTVLAALIAMAVTL